jgi:hypothetical protein
MAAIIRNKARDCAAGQAEDCHHETPHFETKGADKSIADTHKRINRNTTMLCGKEGAMFGRVWIAKLAAPADTITTTLLDRLALFVQMGMMKIPQFPLGTPSVISAGTDDTTTMALGDNKVKLHQLKILPIDGGFLMHFGRHRLGSGVRPWTAQKNFVHQFIVTDLFS